MRNGRIEEILVGHELCNELEREIKKAYWSKIVTGGGVGDLTKEK